MELRKTVIKRDTCMGDAMQATTVPDYNKFVESIQMHKRDVSNIMNSVAEKIIENADIHDYTKLIHIDQFYNDMCRSIEDKNVNFKDLPWYNVHVATERHHINDGVKEDTNLLDIIEMLADGVAAGYARKGSVYPANIDKEVLYKAFQNTFKMMCDSIELQS